MLDAKVYTLLKYYAKDHNFLAQDSEAQFMQQCHGVATAISLESSHACWEKLKPE